MGYSYYLCLLICAVLKMATSASITSTLEDYAVGEECSEPTPTMGQFIGKPILLKCSIDSSEKNANVWSKITLGNEASPLDISNGTELRIQNRRYTVVQDSVTSSFDLQIQNLQTTDAGLYQCTVTGPNGDRRFKRIELVIFQ